MKKIINNKHYEHANYTGIVTISIYNKETLISTTTAHNTGMPKLFNFINSCLDGDFQAAKKSRPCKIILLENESLDESSAISAPVLYDRSTQATTEDTGGSTTYHFRIPSLCLAQGKEIKSLLLMPSLYTTFNEACAKFILPNSIILPEKSNNITVVIEWTLIFTNKEEK